MGTFINTGNYSFSECRNGLYVDKSGMISFVNSKLFTKDKFLCVTRARRFGKSFAANMLCAYYDISCDSHNLFDDLEIAKDGSYTEHLNKYPTIYVDMTKFVSRKKQLGRDMVDVVEKQLIKDLAKEYPSLDFAEMSLGDALLSVYHEIGEQFIFIIDEWDAILREFADEKTIVKDWIDFLRSLFKNETVSRVFAGVYITGILPIIKYDSQSALNNFKEYNMIDPGGIGQYFGFTEEEVQSLCKGAGMDYGEMKSWYDGYKVGDIGGVFNPNSVMEAISRKKCGLYWKTTGAGDELRPYLKNEMKEDVEKLLGGEGIPVDTTSFDNSIKDVDTKDKVFTVLIHLGYLSFDGNDALIPNRELLLYFASCVKNADLGGLTRVLLRSEETLRSIRYNDEEQLSRLIGLSHDDICGATEYNKEQLLYTTLRESLIFAHRDYIFHREYPTGKGFADLVLIPFSGRDLPAIVIELKWDKTAEGPIAQIKERNYPQKLFDYTGTVKLVGINYDKTSKVHECTIETVERQK
ncbi:MAG: AAA family ATPase [Bacteroidales bacterium]|nr:AAA family ATPase [Bacteroidales bacterium]